MFFIFSKLLMFALSPLVWIITILSISLFSRSQKIRKKLLVTSVILLFFFSNSFILDEFYRMWEVGYYKASDIEKTYDIGILLGGMADYDKEYDKIIFNKSADRILQTVHLYHQEKIKKIMVVSGSGKILEQDIKEADFIYEYLIQTGIPPEDIIIENQSKNTRENAVNAKIILDQLKPQQRLLLISSAFHLRRAKGCFEKVGIQVDIYAADKKVGKRKFQFDHMFIPDKEAFYYWDLFIHEVFGYSVYKVMGYL